MIDPSDPKLKQSKNTDTEGQSLANLHLVTKKEMTYVVMTIPKKPYWKHMIES